MSDGMFPNHARSGDWQTLKGRMLSPYVAMPMESVSKNRGGVETGTKDAGWDSQIMVTTGLTHGGGAMAH